MARQQGQTSYRRASGGKCKHGEREGTTFAWMPCLSCGVDMCFEETHSKTQGCVIRADHHGQEAQYRQFGVEVFKEEPAPDCGLEGFVFMAAPPAARGAA